MNFYPTILDTIFEKFKLFDIKPIIVGGFVRDFFLGICSKDIDIELYGILDFSKLEKILEEFGTPNSVGKSFGVCKLHFNGYELDFSLPRKDSKKSSGHRGFEIKIDSNLDFKTASLRRDFTINSMGYDVFEKNFLDPLGGLSDLRDGVLRECDEKSFADDPLRVLRAVRFCARYELDMSAKLFELCSKMTKDNLLDELPQERVFDEIKKLLLFSKKPSIGFELLKHFGSPLYTKNAHLCDEILKHKEANMQTNLVLMLALICYDFPQNVFIRYMSMLTNEKMLLRQVTALIENIDALEDIKMSNLDSYKICKIATKVSIKELLILNLALGRDYEELEKKAKKLHVLNEKLKPILQGRHLKELNFTPSPLFAKILDEAYEAQMQGKIKDIQEAKKFVTTWQSKN